MLFMRNRETPLYALRDSPHWQNQWKTQGNPSPIGPIGTQNGPFKPSLASKRAASKSMEPKKMVSKSVASKSMAAKSVASKKHGVKKYGVKKYGVKKYGVKKYGVKKYGRTPEHRPGRRPAARRRRSLALPNPRARYFRRSSVSLAFKL